MMTSAIDEHGSRQVIDDALMKRMGAPEDMAASRCISRRAPAASSAGDAIFNNTPAAELSLLGSGQGRWRSTSRVR